MRRRSAFLAAAVAAVTALAPVTSGEASPASPGVNSAGSRRAEVAITFFLSFQPDGSARGTFTAAGSVSDSGTALAHPVVTPRHGQVSSLHGDLTLYGSRGAITWSFNGVTYPIPAPRAIGRGEARVVRATGDYEELTGRAAFVTTVDFVVGTVGGALWGHAHQP